MLLVLVHKQAYHGVGNGPVNGNPRGPVISTSRPRAGSCRRLAGEPGTGLRGGPQAATDLSVTSHPGGPGAAAAVGLGVDPGLSGRPVTRVQSL